MGVQLCAYENGDHTCLLWFPADFKPIADCRGVGIVRRLTRAGVTSDGYLPNFVGFSDSEARPPAELAWQWPVQRFMWWDYAVQPGDLVSYSITPVIRDAEQLKLLTDLQSAFSPELQITGQVGRSLTAYFNKGIIAAQWVARELKSEADKLATQAEGKKDTMTKVMNRVGDPLRDALGGLLRVEMLAALDQAIADGGVIYAALPQPDRTTVLVAGFDGRSASQSNCFEDGASAGGILAQAKATTRRDIELRWRRRRVMGRGFEAYPAFGVSACGAERRDGRMQCQRSQ